MKTIVNTATESSRLVVEELSDLPPKIFRCYILLIIYSGFMQYGVHQILQSGNVRLYSDLTQQALVTSSLIAPPLTFFTLQYINTKFFTRFLMPSLIISAILTINLIILCHMTSPFIRTLIGSIFIVFVTFLSIMLFSVIQGTIVLLVRGSARNLELLYIIGVYNQISNILSCSLKLIYFKSEES